MGDEKRRVAGIRMGGSRPEGEKPSSYKPPAPERDEEPIFRVSDKFGGGGTKFRSMRTERVKSMLKQIEEDPRFINAAIVMLGCFFLLLLFPYYPIWLLPLPLLVVGIIAFRSAPFGTIATLIAAFPAVAYQSPLFAWLFLGVLSATMFRAFDTWKLISVLFILVCSPFTAFGFLIIPFHVLAGLLLGSKRGALVTAVTILTVLLLSATWGAQNSGFMVFNKGMFDAHVYPVQGAVFSALAISKAPPAPLALGSVLISALFNMFDWGTVVAYLNSAINAVIYTTGILLLNDSGAVQIVGWTVAVFLVGFIPGHMRSKKKNTIASLSAFLILLTIIVSTIISHAPFNPISIPSTFLAVGIVWYLERKGIDISREIEVRKGEMMEKFSKFGLQDLSLARGVERLKDIGGYEKTKKELYDAIIVPLQKRELQTAYGLKPPKGILLFGPPGTGKTMLMRALAREMDIGFYYVKASDLLSQWYGETEQNVAELFKIARANAPCVLFFDEIDAIGKKRDSYTADDVAPRLLSVMLSEMDGFKSSKSVIIAGATNVPYELDPALLRPGRLDKIVYMPLPDRSSRKQIFKVHTRALPLSDDIDFDDLADKTERYSGADIANICTEAARQAAKLATAADRVVPVTQNDFITVLDNVRPSTSLAALEGYDKFKLDFERQVSPEKREKPDKAVKWKDVVGLDDVREALLEALELPLLHSDLMKEYNVEPIKGVLLFGPPGCGKTMIVKAAANEMDVAFLSLSGADLLKMGYEGAMGQIRDTFNRAKEQAPTVIFIDEIDAIAPSRGIAGSSPLGEKIVAQFLAEMDGLKELKNVLSVGATNRPEIMDSAIMRPGRFDKVVFIHPPLAEGRLEILNKNLKQVPLSRDVNLPLLAKRLDGFSGADIVSICQEAKMRLVRGKISGKKGELGMKDFLNIISGRKPSITPTMMKGYMDFLEEHGERR